MAQTQNIIDFHAHAFQDKIAVKAAENLRDYYHLPLAADGKFRHLMDSMEANGIAKLVVHTTANKPGLVRRVNQYIASLTSERIIGFGTLHPDLEDVEEEIRWIEQNGLRGVKLHPIFQHFVMDCDEMMPIYEKLEGRLPILMHVGDENSDAATPRRLAAILDRFPKLTVIAAHLGGYREWEDAERYVIGRNCYIDTSSAIKFLPPERSRELIRKHGVERVLFGTDYPLSLHAEELAYLNKLQLTEKEMKAILTDNAQNLFKH